MTKLIVIGALALGGLYAYGNTWPGWSLPAGDGGTVGDKVGGIPGVTNRIQVGWQMLFTKMQNVTGDHASPEVTS